MTADRSPHDEADDRLTRACAADGHPPADPDDPTERCACGEMRSAYRPDVRRTRARVEDRIDLEAMWALVGDAIYPPMTREDTP